VAPDKRETNRWRFAADRGGTFTDVIGLDPEGRVHTIKVLSHSDEYMDPAVEGIRRILGIESGKPLPEKEIECIRLGTTVATNALLERKGGKVLLLVTKGFGDLFEIGYQSREELFSLCIKKPEVLYKRVIEVEERIGPSGEVVQGLDKALLVKKLRTITPDEYDAVAVVLMHAWRNPTHELYCEEILKNVGFKNIYLSHRTSRQIKIVPRGQATLVDAYLSPVLKRYRETLDKEIGSIPLEFFISSGGTVRFSEFMAKDALLSGPAGGVLAVADTVEKLGLKGAIGFDMGGTSTDVCRYDGYLERVFEKKIGGIEVQTEMLDINTVASGGGSVLWFDGRKMRVGPQSAGAYPGPACYGFGGPLTITDANLLTGRLIPEFLPKTFGVDRHSSVDVEVVREGFAQLTERINRETNSNLSPEDVAMGFIKVANEKMAIAIREVSVARGVDVRGYSLVCYGGAAGQHACQVASLLGMKEVVFHPLCSLMSAYGIAIARPVKKVSRSYMALYTPERHTKLEEQFREMEHPLMKDIDGPFILEREVDLRVKGSDTSITVKYRDYKETLREFVEHHTRIYGFYRPDRQIEVSAVRSTFQLLTDFLKGAEVESSLRDAPNPGPLLFQKIYTEGEPLTAPVYRRETLPVGFVIKGLAMIVDDFTTIIIEKGFEAMVREGGFIVAKNLGTLKEETKVENRKHEGPDPVLLEVFNNLFSGIATEMGHTLRNTAHSVNIKERLDFSCAVFDPEGGLVTNAPHIPVHLGSMADTVKAILEQRGDDIRPGDVYITNNPYRGGSHLPDLTVVYPVFSKDGELLFFTASRGHHSDIGGKTPGSMPPEARDITEEGIVIDCFLLMREGHFREEQLRRLLSEGPYPVRDIEQSVADITAQVAACRKGERLLKELIQRYGYETVKRYMSFIQENAEYSVKAALYGLIQKGERFEGRFEEHLDDGTPLKVRVIIEPGESPPESLTAEFDFTGTGPEHLSDSLNAPLPVIHSVVLYVLRTLTDSEIPLNSGCLRPVIIKVPEGTVLNPRYPAPVASGNVETSQRVVDILLGALGVSAASQGTMNNLLFQVDGESPYYETLGGGTGGVEGCPGASAVQVHMTNTRITDPEILEVRHPGVRLKRFSIRRGSGGKGLYPGGDGLIREIEFLKDATVTIISERRNTPAFGIKGGGSGSRGVNLLRSGERIKRLPHRVTLRVKRGDSIIIKTPGGGGYG
jgi:5-oxoprolinase (ATP-hydrolysing)